VKQKKAIVFFSAGLGDAVLLIPLIKSLKERGFHVTGFFNSVHPCEEIFSRITLLDDIVVCKNKNKQALFSLAHLFKFDAAFVNYFASNRKNMLTACLLAQEVFTNRKVNSWLLDFFRSKIKYTEPIPDIHDAEQNLHLTGKQVPKVSLQDFHIDFNPVKRPELPDSFIAVQVSAGNNKITYKNWPVKNWIEFLKLLLQNYPEKKIVLLGDANEVILSEQITTELKTNVYSFIGKTNVSEAMNILSQSEFFIGLDGGLMHLAVALKKPTFTIWGPSSIILYGYDQFNAAVHKCVHLLLSCNPCSAWINPNHSKAKNPESCPDHVCLMQLQPQEVFTHFKQYVNSLPANAW